MKKTILPQKTAIKRKSPSRPLKWALENFDLKDKKILDFGCGYGVDFTYLKTLGMDAYGYDKFLKNDKSVIIKNNYDIVFCFYVLNVLPKEEEQVDLIKDVCFLLKEDGISIFALRAALPSIKGEAYGKGVITKINTFQRAYSKKDKTELVQLFMKSGMEIVDFKIENHMMIILAKKRK